MSRRDGERQLSQSLWAHVASISPLLLLLVWPNYIEWLFEFAPWSIGSIVLVIVFLKYFDQSVFLHDAYIRVGDSRGFRRDIVDLERGRFVVELRDAYGERLPIRRWILSCRAEEELDAWLDGVACVQAPKTRD